MSREPGDSLDREPPSRRRIFGRRRRPDGDALDRSLTHFRIVIGLAAVVLSGWALQREGDLVHGVGLAAGLVVILLAATERLLRRRCNVLRLSAVMIAADTALLLIVLGVNDVEPGDPASVLLVLPLIQAGIRHGVFGVVTVWAVTAMALFGDLAITWNGAPEQAQSPMKLAMILLAVGVPAGRLAEHLANRLGAAADELARVDLRSDALMTVLEGAAAMASAGANIDSTLVRFADELVEGDARIVAATPQGAVGPAVIESADGPGVIVVIGLGGTPPRTLEVAVDPAPDTIAVEALELLAANFRTLTGRQSVTVGELHVEATVEAPVGAGVGPAAEPVIGPDEAPLPRSIDDLLHDTVPAGGILDRPELNAVVTDLLGAPGHARVGLALVSLDNLKLLNDVHGRAAGNHLIEATTDRLMAIYASPAPIIGWMGGDDFVVVFPDVDGLEDLEASATSGASLAASVRAALSGSVDLGRFGATPIHAGIGGAIADGEMTGPMLMRVATEQMVADRREQNRRFLANAEHAFGLDGAETDEAHADAHAVDVSGFWFDDTSPTARP